MWPILWSLCHPNSWAMATLPFDFSFDFFGEFTSPAKNRKTIYIPSNPCMLYLPTFATKINHMWVNIRTIITWILWVYIINLLYLWICRDSHLSLSCGDKFEAPGRRRYSREFARQWNKSHHLKELDRWTGGKMDRWMEKETIAR